MVSPAAASASEQFTAVLSATSNRRLRSENRTQLIDQARNLLEVGLAVGDRGAVAAALATLVRRPGTSGRTYVPGGENELASTFPDSQLATYAMKRPIAVIPGKAYAVLDVDYDRASDWQAARAQADDLVELSRRSSVPVARVRSGTTEPGRPANEHIWLVLGDYGFRAAALARLRPLLLRAYPLLTVRGAVTGAKLPGQLIRPPAGRHRSGAWSEVVEPDRIFEILASPGPPSHGWQAFLTGLGARVPGSTPHRRVQLSTPKSEGRIADWAQRLLRDGPESGRNRSDVAAGLIMHLYVCGWSIDAIVAALLDSPAGQYLRDRPGRSDPRTRTRDDVERVIAKYGARPPAAARQLRGRARRLSNRWAEWSLPGTPVWFTRSGRVLLRALLEELARTGHPTVTAQQRTIADSAGIGLATVSRTLKRLETRGLVQLFTDEHGHVRACRPVLDAIADICPLAERSGTSREHTPGPNFLPIVRHDAWGHRPPGAPTAVGLGRPCQRALALLEASPSTNAELARRYECSRDYAAQLLRRLAAHQLIRRQADGAWHVRSSGLSAPLDAAAALLGSGGMLDQRGARYAAERAAWAAAQQRAEDGCEGACSLRLLPGAGYDRPRQLPHPRAGPTAAAA